MRTIYFHFFKELYILSNLRNDWFFKVIFNYKKKLEGINCFSLKI